MDNRLDWVQIPGDWLLMQAGSITKAVGPYGSKGLPNLRAGLPPSGIISSDASPFAKAFNPNAPGRIANP